MTTYKYAAMATDANGNNQTGYFEGPDLQSVSADTAAIAVIREAPINVKDPEYGAVGDNVANDTAAVEAAIAATGTAGGDVFFPPGIYRVASTIVVPGGVRLVGTSLDFSVVTATPARGSIIKASGAISGAVVQLGDDLTSTDSGETGASLDHLIIDGSGQATSAVRTNARRNVIQRCQIWRGSSQALDMAGQNGHVLDSVIGQDSTGYTIKVGNTDNKIRRNQIREGGGAQIRLDAAQAVEISGNHIYGISATGTNRHDIDIVNISTGGGGIHIVDNIIEATAGHHIRILVGVSTTIGRFTIVGNTFYQVTGAPNDTYDCVFVDVTAASSALRQMTVMGSTFNGPANSNYRAFITRSGSNTMEQIAVIGNQGAGARLLANGFTPDVFYGNSTRYFNGSTTDILRSDNYGRSTQNGNGSATAFTIAHGLAAAPGTVTVTPGHADAKGDFHVTVDATNITVTYATAPASGTNNVVLNWRAQL